jgi:hypothetical protein
MTGSTSATGHTGQLLLLDALNQNGYENKMNNTNTERKYDTEVKEEAKH